MKTNIQKLHNKLKELKKGAEDSKEYSFSLESSREAVKKFQSKIYKLLPNSVASDIFAMGVKELVVNALDHGNEMKKTKKVKIILEKNEKFFYGEIEDEGKGFDWEKKLKKEFNLESDSEHGRGLMIIDRCCDVFFYNKKGNKAYLLKENNF